MRGLELWKKIKRVVLPKEIQRKELKPWDHIYTWSRDNTKRHGIYDGKRVIQLNITRAAGFIHNNNNKICPICGDQFGLVLDADVIISTPLDDFLSGGSIYLFEYGVDLAHFGLANLWEDTCTLASSDPPKVVEERASFLLNNGSADYYRYINNGKDFAIYCKTGLLVIDSIDFRRSWQTAFFLAITAAAVFDYQHQLMLVATFCGLLGRYVGIYCICRFASDIGAHPNVIKVEVERLPKVDEIVASGSSGFGVVQSYTDLFLRILMTAFFFCLLSSKWSEPLQVWSWTLKVVWTLPCILFFYWAVLQRRLLPNKIQKEQLKPGDHIYTYRRAYTYAHHGVYVGNRKVIHLDRGEDPISNSGGQPMQYHVDSCCINCFLDGGELYLYKYGVNLAFFIATTRGGTCTTYVSTDSVKRVRCRANLLLKHKDYGIYNLFNNNCEDFTVYCKTGLLSTRIILNHGKNGQIASFVAICFSILFLIAIIIPSSNCIDLAATFYFIYSMFRFITDDAETGKADKVPVKKLAAAFRSRNDMRRLMRFCFGGSIFGGFLIVIYLIVKGVFLCFQKLL